MYVCICECSRAWRCLISGADTHLVLTSSGYVAFFMRRISKNVFIKYFRFGGEKPFVCVLKVIYVFVFWGMWRVPPWKKEEEEGDWKLKQKEGEGAELPCRPAWGVLGIFPANDEKRRKYAWAPLLLLSPRFWKQTNKSQPSPKQCLPNSLPLKHLCCPSSSISQEL